MIYSSESESSIRIYNKGHVKNSTRTFTSLNQNQLTIVILADCILVPMEPTF